MSAEPLWDGEQFIADKSVWDRAGLPQIRPLWEQALRADQIVTCAISRLELLYSARGGDEFASWEADLAALRDIPITRSSSPRLSARCVTSWRMASAIIACHCPT